ncbi:MAG: hypothetical protein GY847_09860 [Proteobacteria bacterium]|nr:hypothetical protein [Pseudomonadota bacterium]
MPLQVVCYHALSAERLDAREKWEVIIARALTEALTTIQTAWRSAVLPLSISQCSFKPDLSDEWQIV